MVLYWKIKVINRPPWDTNLVIKTWPRDFTKISSWRDFEIYTESGEKIVVATSEWVLIDTRKFVIGRIDEKLIQDYGMVKERIFEEEVKGKLKEPTNLTKICEYTASRRDIDTNHHVYNVNYLDFAYDALPEDVKTSFSDIEIYYKKQIKLGDTISLFYSQEENSSIVTIKSKDEKILHAILKFS